MTYLGNFADDQTVDFKFTTVTTTGAPTTLAGTPAISVYKNNDTTQTTTGVTLTVDFDSVTGLNHVRIATTDAFYALGTDYQVVITTGTVGGTSVVGYVVGLFSLENRTVNALTAGVITATSIAADAITAAKIANGAIDAATFAAGAIDATALAADCITAAKIANGAIDAATFAAGAIDAAAIATDAVGAAELATDAANEIADALLDRAAAIETGITPRQALRLITAAEAGKLSGAATTTVTIRNASADTKDRIVATVDASGNRSAVTLDMT